MSDFFVYVPNKKPSEHRGCKAAPFSTIQDHLLTNNASLHSIGSCEIAKTSSNGTTPFYYTDEDVKFGMLVKGVMFDATGEHGPVDPENVADIVSHKEYNALNRYEGTFACFIWDEATSTALVFNDQLSQLSLYYSVTEDGLYASTAAIPLAKYLGLELDPQAVQEFLATGILLNPKSMFAGLNKMEAGELIQFQDGKVSKHTIWDPIYNKGVKARDRAEAVEILSDQIVDHCQRYSAASGSKGIVCDITGGYDSRLLAAACESAGIPFGLTVNGLADHADVTIAIKLARACGKKLSYFDGKDIHTHSINVNTARQFLHQTSGELPVAELFRNSLARPKLADEYDLHFNGGGGEFFRYYPWSQEFFGIGRRKPASHERSLRYRYCPSRPKPEELFIDDWFDKFVQRLGSDIKRRYEAYPGTLTTQQIDAAYVWRKSGNPSTYLTSLFNWLPTVGPFLTASVIEIATAVPWKIRLSSQFQRQMIARLSPELAAIETEYGGLGGPFQFANISSEFKQIRNRSKKLVLKFCKMWFGRTDFRFLQYKEQRPHTSSRPNLSLIIDELIDNPDFRCASLVDQQILQQTKEAYNRGETSAYTILDRLLTIEMLCLELEFTPQKGFLDVD